MRVSVTVILETSQQYQRIEYEHLDLFLQIIGNSGIQKIYDELIA